MELLRLELDAQRQLEGVHHCYVALPAPIDSIRPVQFVDFDCIRALCVSVD